MFQTS